MTRAAALILVLTLTGTPIAALACVGLCGQPPITGSQAAGHDDHAVLAEVLSLSASHPCTPTLLDAPVVVAGTQLLLQEPMRFAALPGSLSVTSSASEVSGLLTPACFVLPPDIPSSHAILRI